MMDFNSEDEIKKELEPDEKLLWIGQPNPIQRMMRSGPIFISLALWVLIMLTFTAKANVEQHPKTALDSPFTGLAIYFVLFTLMFGTRPFMKFQKSKRTVYGLTQKRLIILVAGRTRQVHSFGSSDISRISRTEKPDGTGDITVVHSNPLDPIYGGYFKTFGIGQKTELIGINNVRDVEHLIGETFALATD